MMVPRPATADNSAYDDGLSVDVDTRTLQAPRGERTVERCTDCVAMHFPVR